MTQLVKPPCDEAVIRCAPRAADLSPTDKAGVWVLLATILGSSMAFIDGSVVNVALPVLQRDLSATVVDAQWVVEAYSLFLSALMLVGGSLGDQWGHKRSFGLGVFLFTVASVLCGLAPQIQWLILARALQGVGGALLIPGSLALISASFDGARRGRAIGTWSGFTAITSAGGPVLGGWIVENATWRWIFFLNVPLAALVLGLLFWGVPASQVRQKEGKKPDILGAFLATLALGGIVYGLIEAGNAGFNKTPTLLSLLVGSAALAAFLFVESRSPFPMLPLSLFRSPTFAGTNLLTFFLYGALSGSLFFVPFNLIGVQGYSPTQAGAANLPLILIIFFLSRWSGGLVARYGAKLPLIIGPSIAALGFALFTRPGIDGSYWTSFFPAFTVLGIGMAISVAPLTTTVMESVDNRHAGLASGINNAVARTAGLLTIAVLGIVVLTAFRTHLQSGWSHLPLSPETREILMAQSNKLLGMELPGGLNPAVSSSLKQIIVQSFILSFNGLMWIAAAMSLASAVCAWLLIQGKAPSTPNR